MMTTRRGCLYTKLFNKKTNEKHLVQSDNLPASEIGLCIRYMCFGVCVCVCVSYAATQTYVLWGVYM